MSAPWFWFRWFIFSESPTLVVPGPAERPVSSASSTLSGSTKNRRQRSARSRSIHSHHSEFLPRYKWREKYVDTGQLLNSKQKILTLHLTTVTAFYSLISYSYFREEIVTVVDDCHSDLILRLPGRNSNCGTGLLNITFFMYCMYTLFFTRCFCISWAMENFVWLKISTHSQKLAASPPFLLAPAPQ